MNRNSYIFDPNALWLAMWEGFATAIHLETMRALQKNAPAVQKELRAARWQGTDRVRRKPLKARARAAHNAKLLFGPLSQFQR